MLTEEEVRERVRYCYLAYIQLAVLAADGEGLSLASSLDRLRRSSLGLGEDDFIRQTMEERGACHGVASALAYLAALYEGFVHALCEVLQVGPEEILAEIPQEGLKKWKEEMGG